MAIPDRQEILCALRVMFKEGDVVELRALKVQAPWGKEVKTASGYFTDMDALADTAVQVGKTAKAVYVVLNRINPALLARSLNEVKYGDVTTTADADITARRLLLIDADPKRPSDTSSSEKEHAAALTRVQQVRDYLTGLGWPEPIVGDSGNGGHLLYRINLEASDKGLVKRVLEGLAVRFNDDIVQIDTGVYNPARISKLYGTVARKGADFLGTENIEARPHRLSRMLSVPETLLPVVIEKLEAVALPVVEAMTRSKQQSYNGVAFDLSTWIEEYDLDVRPPKTTQQGTVWVFNSCPWNEKSADPHADDEAAYIFQHKDGGIAAGCHHERCSGNDWASLRMMVEPLHKQQTAKKDSKNEAPANGPKPKIMSARNLMQTILEPTRSVVGNILVEGVTILAGRQKIGKSWFILNLALAVAQGKNALEKIPTEKGDVLYISLEDNQAAMQERLDVLLGKEEAPDNFYISHEWNPFNFGGMEDIEGFLVEHPTTRLVVIDTLARVRPPTKANSNAYYDDYNVIAPLKKIADQYKISLLLVHHFRKSDGADPYDAVSGSTGLTGASDATMLLKRERSNMEASLMLTGRKVREQELALSFSGDCRWSLLGGAAEVRRTEFENEAIAVLTENGPMSPSEYAKATGRKREVVKVQLSRMFTKNLIRSKEGKYYVTVVTSVTDVTSVTALPTHQSLPVVTSGNNTPQIVLPTSNGSTGSSTQNGNSGNAGNRVMIPDDMTAPCEHEDRVCDCLICCPF